MNKLNKKNKKVNFSLAQDWVFWRKMTRKMLTRTFLSLKISNFSGRDMPPDHPPLVARVNSFERLEMNDFSASRWLLQFAFSDNFHNRCLLFQHFPLTWLVIVYPVNLKKIGSCYSMNILWAISCRIPKRKRNDKLLLWNLFWRCPVRDSPMLCSRVTYRFTSNVQHQSGHMIKRLLT